MHVLNFLPLCILLSDYELSIYVMNVMRCDDLSVRMPYNTLQKLFGIGSKVHGCKKFESRLSVRSCSIAVPCTGQGKDESNAGLRGKECYLFIGRKLRCMSAYQLTKLTRAHINMPSPPSINIKWKPPM